MSFVYLLSQRISLFNSGKLELWIISFFSSTTSKVHTTHERNQPYIRLREEGIGHLKITIIETQVVKDLLWHDNIPNVNIIEWSLLLQFQEGDLCTSIPFGWFQMFQFFEIPSFNRIQWWNLWCCGSYKTHFQMSK